MLEFVTDWHWLNGDILSTDNLPLTSFTLRFPYSWLTSGILFISLFSLIERLEQGNLHTLLHSEDLGVLSNISLRFLKHSTLV